MRDIIFLCDIGDLVSKQRDINSDLYLYHIVLRADRETVQK